MTDISTEHHFKASDLVAALEHLIEKFGDADVIICKATGGDYDYSPFADTDIGWYLPDSTWAGEFAPDYFITKYPDDYEHYPEEGVRALVLSPVN